MHIDRDSPRLPRRHVLRGLGVALALPFLDIMRPARAAAASRVGRSVFIYLPNGVNTLDWQITEAGRNYALSKTLAPLAAFRDRFTPISGLYHPHGLGHHHNCRKIWLTGGKLGDTERNTISVDQLIAAKTAPLTRFTSLELSNQGASLAWNGDGIQLPAQGNPGVAFREMFQEPAGGADAQRRRLARKASILDAVLDQARGLERQLGSDDRGRLDQYLTSVREVEVRTERADRWLDTPRPTIAPDVAARLDRAVSLEQLGEYLRTMYDIIVLAFQTDMTRVVTFSTGEEGQGPAVPEAGVKQDRHSLSHHNGNPTLMADLTTSDTFNVQQLAYLIGRLAEVRDAEGPLLDSSIVVFGSGMAFGHSHGNANLPIVLAGGSSLGLKHGGHVDYNRRGEFAGYTLSDPGKHYAICHRPVNPRAHFSNLLLTVAQRMGVETDAFADANGIISEVVA